VWIESISIYRIPDAGRFELRLADGAVNPYLLQAAILASGLDGIERKLNPGPRSDWNGHLPAPNGIVLRTLPTTLLDALRKLSDSQFLRQALGEEFTTSYVEVQMEQWRSYSRHLSQWELDNTLDC
jgi:glutamine synthetase